MIYLMLTEDEADRIHYVLTKAAETNRKYKEIWIKATKSREASGKDVSESYALLYDNSSNSEQQYTALADKVSALLDVTKPYAWMIDKDHQTVPPSLVEEHNVGPRGASKAAVDALKEGSGHRFRLLNEEGKVCFEGRIVMCHADDKPGFQPLRAVNGCVAIQYYDIESQTWITR